MDETLKVSRDYEIRFVRWLMQRRLLLLAIVCVLVAAMAGAVIGALWITRVKEETPGMLVRIDAAAGLIVVEIDADRAAHLRAGHAIGISAKEMRGDPTSSMRGVVARIDPLSEEVTAGEAGYVSVRIEHVEVPPDWGRALDDTGRREVTLAFRSERALSLVLERDFRGKGAGARGRTP